MIRHGEAPYLECSSRGDRRFSAFYAVVDGKTIEALYQGYKIISMDGRLVYNQPIYIAKGRVPVNPGQCAIYYAQLWDRYMREHPELLPVLKEASGLSDAFGQSGHVCQATELWRIRNES